MNQFSDLLKLAAQEARAYRPSQDYMSAYDPAWIERIAVRLEHAANLGDASSVEREMMAIARAVVDCGPLEAAFIPSFDKAHYTSQHQFKAK